MEVLLPPPVHNMQLDWLKQQNTEQSLVGWPERMIENFAVVGLSPDMEITKIAEDLCGQFGGGMAQFGYRQLDHQEGRIYPLFRA
jgi:hypothetical protein